VSKEGDDGESFTDVMARIVPDWYASRLRSFFTSNYLTFDTGDLNRLSSTIYDEGEEFDGAEVVMTDGYDRIAQHLATGLDIRLNEPVARIVGRPDSVKIDTSKGTINAKHAIVAVPLGVLKTDTISFEPLLPQSHRDAISAIGFNAVNKFLFVWDRTFWDNTDFLAYTSDRRDLFGWFANVNILNPGANALMTFAFADEARASESKSDEELTELVMSHLRDMYGPDTPKPSAMSRSRWVTDPNIRGAYSFTSVDTRIEHFETFAEPAGHIHFAGEHTDPDYFSTVHGAYLSGRRAAAAILG
jgi:monoamine oxidase